MNSNLRHPKIGMTSDYRKYIIQGEEYARVTDICSIIRKPGLEMWKIRVGKEESERIARETGEYGDLVHEITALNDMNKMDEVEVMLKKHEFLLPPWVAWFDWVGEYVKEILHVELIVWSGKMKCAGKVDRIAVMKGDNCPSILDLKTGNLYDEIGIQLHGYKKIYNEKNKRKVKRTLAVQLPRTDPGTIKIKEYDNPKYTTSFKAAVQLYYSTK